MVTYHFLFWHSDMYPLYICLCIYDMGFPSFFKKTWFFLFRVLVMTRYGRQCWQTPCLLIMPVSLFCARQCMEKRCNWKEVTFLETIASPNDKVVTCVTSSRQIAYSV